MIATGVSDDSTIPFLGSERSNFVISAANLKSPDRLQVFQLQEKLAGVGRFFRLAEVKGYERSSHGHAAQARLSFADVGEVYDLRLLFVILSRRGTSTADPSTSHHRSRAND
jgi:hypothetical protein